MPKPYSVDLRERVVMAVEDLGLSRRQAAAHFGVSYSSAILWVKRYRETGSLKPRRIGGLQAEEDCGRVSRLAVVAVLGGGLHAERPGWRVGGARS